MESIKRDKADRMHQRSIGPVQVQVITRARALDLANEKLLSGESWVLAFCNAHSVNLARQDPALTAALNSATVLNDGLGVDIASRLLHGRRFPDNLNGTDFTPALLERSDRPLRIFLLGSRPTVVEKSAAVLQARYPRHQVVGTHHGFFLGHEEGEVADRIKRSGADLVLIGMGQPRQEIWAAAHLNEIPATLMCVGAYLDFVGGKVSRAPRLVRKMRLEWVYRLILEPRRLARRYLLGNVAFLYHTLCDVRSSRRQLD